MIVADMLLDLRQKHVEVWTITKPDGPAFDGTLVRIVVGPNGFDEPASVPDDDTVRAGLPVVWLGLRDRRGLDIRIPGDAVVAVVVASGG